MTVFSADREEGNLRNRIICGDALEVLSRLPRGSVNCCVTSPPYWGLRDYGVDGQIGLDESMGKYIERLVGVFREVRRVLDPEGTLWLNLGDSYVTSRTARKCDLSAKNLAGIPWRVALALQTDGWYLRSDIIWNKPNCLPESASDRPVGSHEYLFLLSRGPKYYYNREAVREPSKSKTPQSPAALSFQRSVNEGVRPGQKAFHHRKDRGNGQYGGMRNRRTVWDIPVARFRGAHFAVFSEKLVEPCILAGCPEGGVVLDPFSGSGTTAAVAYRLGREYIGIELNPEYAALSVERLAAVSEKREGKTE